MAAGRKAVLEAAFASAPWGSRATIRIRADSSLRSVEVMLEGTSITVSTHIGVNGVPTQVDEQKSRYSAVLRRWYGGTPRFWRSTPSMNERAQALAARLIRNVDAAQMTRSVREPLYDSTSARITPGTAATKLGASIDVLAPGKRGCPYHLHHAQEEMFVILEGEGTLRVAGEMLPLRAGDVVFIPPGPEYPHQIINTSDAPLKFLSISTQEQPEICEYPDSGKFLARSGPASAGGLAVVQRSGETLDYWDAEP